MAIKLEKGEGTFFAASLSSYSYPVVYPSNPKLCQFLSLIMHKYTDYLY